MPEFKRTVLEVMRQPSEDRVVTISRAKFTIEYPASFMLAASMNPSPSGYFPDDPNKTSSTIEMQRYMNKLSGPLLDRIDIHIEVSKVEYEQLTEKRKGESSASIRARVNKARDIQMNDTRILISTITHKWARKKWRNIVNWTSTSNY